jgi:hypothetical protein
MLIGVQHDHPFLDLRHRSSLMDITRHVRIARLKQMHSRKQSANGESAGMARRWLGELPQ